MSMIFWFLIMLLDIICVIGFSVNLITDFTILNVFIVACFVISGIFAVLIFKSYIHINKKSDKSEIVSLHQLRNKN